MTDREALAAALRTADESKRGSVVGWWLEQQGKPLIAAARERLAQLPEKCGTCHGLEVRTATDPYAQCPICHGSGKVYPAELVERIAAELHHGEQDLVEFLNLAQARLVTVVVLDALNGETP